MERTLYEIASVFGTPLLIDHVTKNRLFGQYARVLIDFEYENLPEFCTLCKSIGHNVNSCRWLPQRKLTKQADKVDNGKKPIYSQRQQTEWQPKDNPDGVGSSAAFEAPKEAQPKAPLIVETQQEAEVAILDKVPQSHTQQVQVQSMGTQSTTENVSAVDQEIPVSQLVSHDETHISQEEHVEKHIVVSSAQHIEKSSTTFNMSLHNVSDDIARPVDLLTDAQPLLTLATDVPDIHKIMAHPDDPVDLVLQREIELVSDSLLHGGAAEVPFTSYLSKAQKKKSNQGSS